MFHQKLISGAVFFVLVGLHVRLIQDSLHMYIYNRHGDVFSLIKIIHSVVFNIKQSLSKISYKKRVAILCITSIIYVFINTLLTMENFSTEFISLIFGAFTVIMLLFCDINIGHFSMEMTLKMLSMSEAVKKASIEVVRQSSTISASPLLKSQLTESKGLLLEKKASSPIISRKISTPHIGQILPTPIGSPLSGFGSRFLSDTAQPKSFKPLETSAPKLKPVNPMDLPLMGGPSINTSSDDFKNFERWYEERCKKDNYCGFSRDVLGGALGYVLGAGILGAGVTLVSVKYEQLYSVLKDVKIDEIMSPIN